MTFPELDSDDGIAAGLAFPEGLSSLELLAFEWPGGATRFVLAIGQLDYGSSQDRLGIDTRFAVRFGTFGTGGVVEVEFFCLVVPGADVVFHVLDPFAHVLIGAFEDLC